MRPPDLTQSPTSSRRRAGIVRRRLISGQSGNGTAQTAATVLGPTHPLPRAVDAVGRVARQWWACAAIVAGALIAQLERHPWAAALALSAGLVLLTLTVGILALRQRVRDEAIQLIAEGRDALPIAVVQRQRQRLVSRRTTAGLARTLETMLGQALNPPRLMTKGARPLFCIRVIASAAPELRGVISLLQTEPARARGVALIERLITDGGSPLYAREARALREELRRVRSALED